MQFISLVGTENKYMLKDKTDWPLLLFLLFILFSTYPYVFYRVIPLPPVAILQIVTFLYYSRRTHLNNRIVNSSFKCLIIIQAIATFLCLVIHSDIGYYKQFLYLFWTYLFLVLINDFGIKRFLYYYNRILTLVAILGALSTCLSLIFGIKPLFEYSNMDGRPGWFVYFTFTNVQTLGIIRYSGIFDEAGAFAGWAIFALITNRLFVKDKKIEYPLMIATLLTFSFAYFFQLIVYIFLFYFIKQNAFGKILVFLVLLVGIVMFNYYIPDDSPAYALTVGRLGLGESTNFFENNNRIEMIEIARNIFYNHPVWGIGTTKFYSGEYAGDNPYETLAKDGLLGSFFIYLPLFWLFVKSKFDKDVFFVLIIVLLGYAQRPFHTNLQHYLMLYLFCYSVYNYYLAKKKILF